MSYKVECCAWMEFRCPHRTCITCGDSVCKCDGNGMLDVGWKNANDKRSEFFLFLFLGCLFIVREQRFTHSYQCASSEEGGRSM